MLQDKQGRTGDNDTNNKTVNALWDNKRQEIIL